MAVGRESGCSVLLSSVNSAHCSPPLLLLCVHARASVFFRRAGDGRTDGLAVFECHRRWGNDWRCHSVATILQVPCYWFRWLDGIFLNSVFGCFRPCFWTSCFWSLSLMGMFHGIGVTGDWVLSADYIHWNVVSSSMCTTLFGYQTCFTYLVLLLTDNA